MSTMQQQQQKQQQLMQQQQQFGLPEGWFAELDKKTNQFYYWNLVTKERTWIRPMAQHMEPPVPHTAGLNRQRSLGSDGGSGLSTPMLSNCSISNPSGKQAEISYPAKGGDSMPPSPVLLKPMPISEAGELAAASEEKEALGMATKRQRATTETMADVPEGQPLPASAGPNANNNTAMTDAPPPLVRSGSSTRKSKLKGLMSIIGKKTSFSRERKRRENVMAETGAAADTSSELEEMTANYPKPPEVEQLLASILRSQYLFQGLSNEDVIKTVNMMCDEKVAAGHVLIRQGDRGDYFYVVEKGTFTVLLREEEGAEEKEVGEVNEGGSFGELALLYGQKRAATIRASTDAVVWKIDRMHFRAMLRSSAKHDIEDARAALRSSPVLSVLTDEQIETVANAVRFHDYEKGAQIIRKGDIGDVFFIIKRGQVQVTGGLGPKGEQSAPVTLGPHAFFGERALLKDEARAANVDAITDVQCLVLDRYAFTTILGPLRQVLDDNIRVSVFKQIELFQHLDESELERLFQTFEVQSFRETEYIIHQGERADKFYILRSGEAKVTQKVLFPNNGQAFTNTVSTLHAGDYFGEMALLENGIREANVIATQACECFVLDRETFEALLGPADSILKRDIRKRRHENAQKHKEVHRRQVMQSQQDRQRKYQQQQQQLLEQQRAEAMDVDEKALNYKLSDLVTKKTLGTGTFGRVQLVQHVHTGATFALKVQSKAQITKYKLQQNIINEKLILATLRHPFIITLHQTFQDRDCLYMLLELVQGGELFSFLQNNGANLERPQHIFYTANIVSAFQYMHGRSILYRDLKPENILIDRTGYLKLVDFGFAKVERHRTFTLCGTPEYFSPELVLGRGYGAQNDVWGLGILMYEIINGYTPFGGPDDNSNEVCKRIVKQPLVFPEDCTDMEAKDLMASLLRKDPLKRLGGGVKGIGEIMAHPWFRLVNWPDLENKRISVPWVPPIRSATDAALFDDYDEDFEVEPYLEMPPKSDWTKAF